MRKTIINCFCFLFLINVYFINSSEIYGQSEKPQSRSTDEKSNKKEITKELNWLSGAWIGEGYQPGALNQKTWTIKLNFNLSTNEILIEYPTFPCSGFWKLEKADNRQAVFIEYITEGKTLCQDAGKMVITKIDDTNISYAAFLPQFQKGVIAFSVLEKK